MHTQRSELVTTGIELHGFVLVKECAEDKSNGFSGAFYTVSAHLFKDFVVYA
jgi:hypothetical protein